MKIGIEVQNIFRTRKHGTDIVIEELLKQLQQNTTRHEFFLYAQSHSDASSVSITRNMHLDVSGPASAYVWEQQMLPAAIKHHNLKLLHCTNNTAPVGLKLPLILTIHDIIYLEKFMARQGTWYQRYENLYTQWNMPRIAKSADLIITVSNYERSRIIEKLKIAPGKVKTIYHACAPHFTSERNEAALECYRHKYSLPEKYVLYFGNTAPAKNMPNVLRSLDILFQLNELNFKVVMPDMTATRLKQILVLYNCEHLEPFIHLTGYIPNAELPAMYKLASLFLYPCLTESFGIPLLEAMACGTPVITSNRGAIPEIADKEAVMIDPKNPEEIAMTIVWLMESELTRIRLSNEGIARAKNFSWQKTTAEIISVYEQFTS